MNRSGALQRIQAQDSWDIIVIGGGASGLGIAVDASSRGYNTLLLEKFDFAKGTSSRSTKLVHGGVRYLQQGNISLVREALRERGLLAKNAAHLVRKLDFIIPTYTWWKKYYYNFGLWLYDKLAGKLSLGRTRRINKDQTIKRISNIRSTGLKGGVVYTDGQFDDSRLAISLAQTVVDEGGTIINYMGVTDLLKDKEGRITGVVAKDQLSGERHEIRSKVVINATGIFTDDILSMSNPGHRQMILQSQGVHLVLDKSFLGDKDATDAIMIPRTSDGRILFAVPWHHRVIIGTTDTRMDEHSIEPGALEKEVSFILENARKYLSKKPARIDVQSVYAGQRPLVAPKEGKKKTKEVSRGYKVIADKTGLISIIGGKWTTYRKMAEDTVDQAVENLRPPKRPCKTKHLSIHGNLPSNEINEGSHLYVYGADIPEIKALEKTPEFRKKLHPGHDITIAEIVWGIRKEMAMRIEDVLARRTRLLFLDARAAIDVAPRVAEIFRKELNWSDENVNREVEDFIRLARNYLLVPHPANET